MIDLDLLKEALIPTEKSITILHRVVFPSNLNPYKGKMAPKFQPTEKYRKLLIYANFNLAKIQSGRKQY